MTKFHYMSDLHLEFAELDMPLEDKNIILAGDITVNAEHLFTIEEWAKRNRTIIYVFGNHEAYHGDMVEVYETTRARFEGTNVHILENESVEIEGTMVHGCTLWTDMGEDPYIEMDIARGMNDFRVVMNGVAPFTTAAAVAKHENSLEFLCANVAEGDVVVTHHAPSIQSVHPMFDGQTLNHGYFSNLETMVEDLAPSHWVHGHMHHRNDYMIGNTRVITNPRGYVRFKNLAGPGRENPLFTVEEYFET